MLSVPMIRTIAIVGMVIVIIIIIWRRRSKTPK